MGKNKKNKNKNGNNNVTKKVENVVEKENLQENVNSNVEEKNKEKTGTETKVQDSAKNLNKVKNNDKKEETNTKKEENIKVDNTEEKNEKEEAKKEKMKEKEEKKEEKEKDLESKKIEKKMKKSANNDTKVIVGIVAAVIIIAFGIFGFYFAKSNLEYCISYDGGTVSNADYEVYYKTFATMLQYYGYSTSDIPKQIANKAALDAILVKRANEAKVTISDEDKEAIEKVFNDKDQLETFTTQGIDIARMRKLYYNDYLITAYIQKLADEANDEDVLNYIKSNSTGDIDLYEYNTSHILFKFTDESGNALDDAAKAEKKKKAEEILQKAKNGEDFATLAKENSEDTTASNGGEYTCYDNGYTLEEYINAVKSLKDGEVYPTIVETSYGYHVIKLNSKVENGRVKSENEREEYVDEQINNLADEKHVTIDEEKLNKLVESITGKAATSDDETSSTSSSSTSDESNTTNESDSSSSKESTDTSSKQN